MNEFFLGQPRDLYAALRRKRLAVEKALYTYLPDASSMQRGGYTSILAGYYLHARLQDAIYRITMLSQTGLLLIFKNGKYVAAQVVKTDEELFRFLIGHDFPLPQ